MDKVKGVVDELKLNVEDRERNEIVNWLTPLDFQTEQKRLFEKCVVAWGKHVIESEEFQRWVKGAPWQLRCYGAAGVGKVGIY